MDGSAAGEARSLVAGTTVAALGTLSSDGTPWTSLVTFGVLPDGSPVLCLSQLAEHARNVRADPRASLLVTAERETGDPLATPRITLAGRMEPPTGDLARAAADAHPESGFYAQFGDFDLWVLRVERVRWIGGYGVVETVDAAAYRAAGAG